MKITRKQFLQLAGFSALGAAGAEFVHAVVPEPAQSAPASGPRWGMAIDFRKCQFDRGCDKCLDACREAHNIPVIPDRTREVVWNFKDHFANVFPTEQTDYIRQVCAPHPLPLLCNHCATPACVRVCPTQATWKRADGVVMMDWHRCIGCRYCMAACPYGSRSFNWMDPRPYIAKLNPDFPTRSKGVVEKCNFCEERLAKNQQPACCEGCPNQAVTFGDLNDPKSPLRVLLATRYAVQRKPELGTAPSIYYLM